MVQFLADPNMTGAEQTLLTAGGDLASSNMGIPKATYREQERIKALESIISELPHCRVVRREDGDLAVSMDREFLYEGSDELQGNDQDNLEDLNEFYSGLEPGPANYRLSGVESFVGAHYASLIRMLKGTEGVEVSFVTNKSFAEARVYLTEAAVNTPETVNLVLDNFR